MTNEEKLKSLSTVALARFLSTCTRYYDTQFGFTFWRGPFCDCHRLSAIESEEDFVKWLKEDAE